MGLLRNLLVLSALLALSACETAPTGPVRKNMQVVMNECDQGQSFDSYVYCVKSTYQSQGTMPNSSAVRAFYANLDAVNEAFLNKTITQVQAKKLTYDAYMSTVHADNVRNQAASDAAFMNSLAVMQRQQQIQLQQQQQQQIKTPIQTNCYRNGSYTNCTSY